MRLLSPIAERNWAGGEGEYYKGVSKLDAMEKVAWQVLRGTQRKLGAPRGKVIATGYSPGRAQAALEAQGMNAAQAARALSGAVLKRFQAFAASWSYYIAEKGWGLELVAMQPEEQSAFEEAFALKGAVHAFEELRRDPLQAMGNVPELIALTAQLSKLETASEPECHPALFFLTRTHGLDPELAKALLLYSREAPIWAIFSGLIISLVFGLIAVIAFVDPQNAMFTAEGGNGAGPLHRILLPLVSLGALGLMAYLAWDRPRRRKAWTAQLRKYGS